MVSRTLFILALLLTLASGVARAQVESSAPDSSAVAAYRDGDLETARHLWLEALEETEPALSDAERGRLCYNLGNLAAREEAHLEAVAWYTASLRLRPRDPDTWANLELARQRAELDPADRGDLAATVERLLGSWTPAEASWLALLGLLPLTVCLLLEALRGGRRWRWLALLAAGLTLICAGPWLRHALGAGDAPQMVLATDGAGVHAEPRADAERIAELDAAEVVLRTDGLPEWIEVQLDDDRRGWMRSEGLFPLSR